MFKSHPDKRCTPNIALLLFGLYSGYLLCSMTRVHTVPMESGLDMSDEAERTCTGRIQRRSETKLTRRDGCAVSSTCAAAGTVLHTGRCWYTEGVNYDSVWWAQILHSAVKLQITCPTSCLVMVEILQMVVERISMIRHDVKHVIWHIPQLIRSCVSFLTLVDVLLSMEGGQTWQCVFGVHAAWTCFPFVSVGCWLYCITMEFPWCDSCQFSWPATSGRDWLCAWSCWLQADTPLLPESDLDTVVDISLDEPRMLNATLWHIDFQPDVEWVFTFFSVNWGSKCSSLSIMLKSDLQTLSGPNSVSVVLALPHKQGLQKM